MKRLKKIWSVGWRVGLCVLLLTWIFHSIFVREGKQAVGGEVKWNQLSRGEQWHKAWTIGPQELWRTISLISPVSLAVAVFLSLVAIMLGVIRWRMVLEVQGLGLPLVRATEISFVSQFFNTFLLGSTGGDLIKAYYAARETHHKKTEAVTTVFVDRLIGLWAMLLFAAVMMVPNANLIMKYKWFSAPSLLIVAMFVALTGVLCVAFWGGVSKRWPMARSYLRRIPKGALLEQSLDSCRQFGKQKMFLFQSSVLSIALNVVWVLQVIVLAGGMGLKVPSVTLFLVVPIVFCISALPITPSGLGVRENLFVSMLAISEIAVPGPSALSLSLLAYAASLFWSVVGGFVYIGRKEKDHLDEVTKGERE